MRHHTRTGHGRRVTIKQKPGLTIVTPGFRCRCGLVDLDLDLLRLRFLGLRYAEIQDAIRVFGIDLSRVDIVGKGEGPLELSVADLADMVILPILVLLLLPVIIN